MGQKVGGIRRGFMGHRPGRGEGRAAELCGGGRGMESWKGKLGARPRWRRGGTRERSAGARRGDGDDNGMRWAPAERRGIAARDRAMPLIILSDLSQSQ